MDLQTILKWLFICSFLFTAIFWFVKKKQVCFFFSLVTIATQIGYGFLCSNWFYSAFWGIIFIVDLYEYKNNSCNFWEHFD